MNLNGITGFVLFYILQELPRFLLLDKLLQKQVMPPKCVYYPHGYVAKIIMGEHQNRLNWN